jgi:hypothetical protein
MPKNGRLNPNLNSVILALRVCLAADSKVLVPTDGFCVRVFMARSWTYDAEHTNVSLKPGLWLASNSALSPLASFG